MLCTSHVHPTRSCSLQDDVALLRTVGLSYKMKCAVQVRFVVQRSHAWCISGISAHMGPLAWLWDVEAKGRVNKNVLHNGLNETCITKEKDRCFKSRVSMEAECRSEAKCILLDLQSTAHKNMAEFEDTT